ncbi:MAG TPA: (2Fe-2S)-binding protein [Candidatus Acidoferrales bacterium]|nr:(2Fe-2S)-binding protein [Candidatus Acidoferrales bacterium]
MAEKPTIEEIRARFRVVCICKGIKAGKISDAIRAGAKTVKDVSRATGSGTGTCGGSGTTRCYPVIVEMLRNGGAPPATSTPETPPPPEDDDYWFPTPVLKKKSE